MLDVDSEDELMALAIALGAPRVAGWSRQEQALCTGLRAPRAALIRVARASIRKGQDPLGETFTSLRSAAERRRRGATYTPERIVSSMVRWATRAAHPARVVDPGCGSGRFLVAAGRAIGGARLLGVEVDPLAASLARAHLAAAGLDRRAEIQVRDFRDVTLPRAAGSTLFIGNPPYVRHHLISAARKRWLRQASQAQGVQASGLAGLHVHFMLAIAAAARAGDVGVLITAAEWMDVNYGSAVRQLLLERLGLRALHVVEPSAQPFPDAATTAVITCFQIGLACPKVTVRRVPRIHQLGALASGHTVARSRLSAETRWSRLKQRRRPTPAGFVQLGELCAVHRGQVTGANRLWISGEHAQGLPGSVLYRCVTRARELFAAGAMLDDASHLRQVVDLPSDLDELSPEARARVEAFLRLARRMGADRTFVARHRRPWWRVGLGEPAPLLTTYMARRTPAFVLNTARAHHLNIAHGIYPRQPMDTAILAALRDHLIRAAQVSEGRTYAGGLTKFEPREMERLMVPGPELLGGPREGIPAMTGA